MYKIQKHTHSTPFNFKTRRYTGCSKFTWTVYWAVYLISYRRLFEGHQYFHNEVLENIGIGIYIDFEKKKKSYTKFCTKNGKKLVLICKM